MVLRRPAERDGSENCDRVPSFPAAFVASTARCAATPSAGLPAADGEWGANLWRPGAVVQRSGGGTRLDRRRQSGPVGGGVLRPAIAGGERAFHRFGHRTRVDSHKLVT